MKFVVKLKLEEKKAGALIRAFFQEFNSKNTLHIKGNDANAEIFFEENPPMEIVEAISGCFIAYFYYKGSEETDASMKFAVKSKIYGGIAGDLIQKFFREFNPKDTLLINGSDMEAEIFFEKNPPMGIVTTIGYWCDIDSFDYGESKEPDDNSELYDKINPNSEAESDSKEESNGKTEPDSEAESDSKAEPNGKVESDSEVEPDSKEKSNGKTEPDSEAEPDNKEESNGKTEPDSKAEPNDKVEPHSEVESDSKEEPNGKREPDSEVEPDNKEESNGKTEPDSEAESDIKAEPNGKAEPHSEVEADSKEELNGKIEHDSEVEPDSKEESNGKAEFDSEVEPDSKVQPDVNTVTKTEYSYIPELTNIAKNAPNYETFLTDVIEWLSLGRDEVGKKREQRISAFLSMEKAVSAGYCKWKQIESHATYNTKDRNVLWSTVSKMMQNCGHNDIKLLSFLKILVLYREYEFNVTATVNKGVANDNGTDMTSNHLNTEETKTSVTKADTNESANKDAEVTGKANTDTGTETAEKVDTDAEIVEKTDTDAETEVTMPCFSEIPWFVDFLKSIDKTKTIEEKVKQVLFKMNLNNSKNTDVKEEILNLAIEAMKTEHIEDMIKQKPWKLRMDFATFLNDFAGEYSTSKVTARDFLKDLQGALV